MTDNRLMEALKDLTDLLSAGINVAASAPVFLQYPWGVLPENMLTPIENAAREGNSSIFAGGIDPGFANDLLPLALMGTCQRIDQVRCIEIVDYATYDSATVMFDVMGFGKPMEETPMLLQPGCCRWPGAQSCGNSQPASASNWTRSPKYTKSCPHLKISIFHRVIFQRAPWPHCTSKCAASRTAGR